MRDEAFLQQQPGLYHYIKQAAYAAMPSSEGQRPFEIVQAYATELVPALAERSGLHVNVIYRLLCGGRISRDDAQRLLQAFAEHTGLDTTLDTVQVLLVPEATAEKKLPFSELFIISPWCVEEIAAQAHVPVEVLEEMLAGQPVTREQAERVLTAISFRLGYGYDLENVEVTVLPA